LTQKIDELEKQGKIKKETVNTTADED